MVDLLEIVKLPLSFQRDLQLREIAVIRIIQMLKELPIHDLGQHLVACHYSSGGRDVENNRLRWDLLDDRLDQHLELVVADPLGQQVAR